MVIERSPIGDISNIELTAFDSHLELSSTSSVLFVIRKDSVNMAEVNYPMKNRLKSMQSLL